MNTQIVDVQLIRTAQQYGISDALSYRIAEPPHIPPRGQIVYVPLGKQIVIGVVVSLTRTTTTHTYKSIIAWADIALTTQQVDLPIGWHVTDATPLGAILPLFIPGGAIGKPTKIWQITTQGHTVTLHELPNDERGALYLLRQHTALSEDDLYTQLNGTHQRIRNILTWLSARGYISTNYTVPAAAVQRSTIAVAQLVHQPTSTELQSLTRAPKQRQFISQLSDAPAHTLPLSHFATQTQLAPLIARGWVIIHHIVAPPTPPSAPARNHVNASPTYCR
jgi:primosomal protein N'